MSYVYPIFVKEHENYFLVFVPDLKLYTEGKTLSDAILNAKEVIELDINARNEIGKEIPKPSDTDEALNKVKQDADEDFDYSDGKIIYVCCN